jgi:hypothetical protein
MDSTLKALIIKKFKDAEIDLEVGRHWVDETIVLRVSGRSSGTWTSGFCPRSASH